MLTSRRFSVNRQVVFEDFEDEIVIINLANGNYYTLSEVGAAIWSRLEQGAAEAEIVDSLAQRYTGAQGEIAQGVRQFIADLETEELIWPLDTAAPATTAPPTPQGDSGAPRPFTAPTLQKYLDMQALLVLDPIHDVDETGWPNPRRASDG